MRGLHLCHSFPGGQTRGNEGPSPLPQMGGDALRNRDRSVPIPTTGHADIRTDMGNILVRKSAKPTHVDDFVWRFFGQHPLQHFHSRTEKGRCRRHRYWTGFDLLVGAKSISHISTSNSIASAARKCISMCGCGSDKGLQAKVYRLCRPGDVLSLSCHRRAKPQLCHHHSTPGRRLPARDGCIQVLNHDITNRLEGFVLLHRRIHRLDRFD